MTKPKELTLIDTKEAARRLNVTVARVSQLVSTEELTPYRKGKPMLFEVSEVERLKQARLAALRKQMEDLRST